MYFTYTGPVQKKQGSWKKCNKSLEKYPTSLKLCLNPTKINSSESLEELTFTWKTSVAKPIDLKFNRNLSQHDECTNFFEKSRTFCTFYPVLCL